uniref:Uncharacterized protein MANES_12G044900 n=1 Tax=Rhizophora mucronata TaxID=61149 RepID=A0A2P2N1I2_RHIMU
MLLKLKVSTPSNRLTGTETRDKKNNNTSTFHQHTNIIKSNDDNLFGMPIKIALFAFRIML